LNTSTTEPRGLGQDVIDRFYVPKEKRNEDYGLIISRKSPRKEKRKRNYLYALMAIVLVFVSLSPLFNVRAANEIEVRDGDNVYTFTTYSSDMEAIVKNKTVQIGKYDIVSFSGIEDSKGVLTIIRRYPVTVHVDGQIREMALPYGTVADVIDFAGITINKNDVCNVSLNLPFKDAGVIEIDRINYKTETKKESITYTEYMNLSGTKKGDRLVKGQDGTVIFTYEYKMVNGKVSTKKVVSQEIKANPLPTEKATTKATEPASTQAKTEAPKPKNIFDPSSGNARSTMKPDSPIELDANGNPVNYKQLIKGKASAYSYEDAESTSTGMKPGVGVVAVNPNQIPYYSKLYIKTPDGSYIYGYAVAGNTGGFAKNGRITVDLFLDTKEECYQFGIKEVEIYVLY